MDTGIQATSDGVASAHGKGMAVVAMEPVKGGMLAHPPPEALAVMERAPVPRSPVDWALQFLWNKPEIALVLSGMSDRDQVEQNCDSAERSGVGTLAPEELAILDELAAVFRRNIVVGCTACGYCMPCKDGVDIPECFATLNNLAIASQGNFSQRIQARLLRRRYKKKPRTPQQLEKHPGSGSGSAALCTDCKACIQKCPQGIDIPTELARAHAVLAEGADVQELILAAPKGS